MRWNKMIINPKKNRNLESIQPELRYGKMKTLIKYGSCASLLAMLMLPVTSTQAAVLVQCPGDDNGDSQWTGGEIQPADTKCIHLSSSDGFANMGDGYLQYVFGYGDITGTLPEDAIDTGLYNANTSAPTIILDEGDEFYLTLTNTGMMNRPDLFDTHTVHFHGFPNASSVFDGVPDASISINMGGSLTYFYNIKEPGTYLYHCHVEAAEHMQMGMQGNLYVRPSQDGTSIEYPVGSGRFYTKFAYNDAAPGSLAKNQGSTGFDVEMPLQLTGFDPVFHDASKNTQPLPFADMVDTYHMFNGRGYPTTVEDENYYVTNPGEAQDENGGVNSQPLTSKVTVTSGQKLLLRITNLSITKFHTVAILGLPMQVIGRGARELTDKYETASVNLGGGEAYDVMVDTDGVEPGTYFVYITELNELSNDQQSFGGPMTEIVVAPAI